MGLPFSGCGWSMAMMLCLIGSIKSLLSNIPPVSTSAAEVTTFFCVLQMVSMRPLSFGLIMLVVGG